MQRTVRECARQSWNAMTLIICSKDRIVVLLVAVFQDGLLKKTWPRRQGVGWTDRAQRTRRNSHCQRHVPGLPDDILEQRSGSEQFGLSGSHLLFFEVLPLLLFSCLPVRYCIMSFRKGRSRRRFLIQAEDEDKSAKGEMQDESGNQSYEDGATEEVPQWLYRYHQSMGG